MAISACYLRLRWRMSRDGKERKGGCAAGYLFFFFFFCLGVFKLCWVGIGVWRQRNHLVALVDARGSFGSWIVCLEGICAVRSSESGLQDGRKRRWRMFAIFYKIVSE